jgi:alkylation response protein AidB-like acyl-CoA dehydrogenase
VSIDFTLTPEQREMQLTVRSFAREVVAPIVREADAEPDPLKAFQMTKEAYVQAYKAGIAYCFLPKEFGGGGLSNLDIAIAAEEFCTVDPGFPTTILVNGLGLMPVLWYGSDEMKERFLRPATSDARGEYIVGYAVSEPAGRPGGTANYDTPMARPTGIGVTAELRGDTYILNGRKYWPCNVAGWDGQGADNNLVVVRTDPGKGGTEGLSAIMVERGTPGVTYNLISKLGHRLTPNAEMIFENAPVPAANMIEGTIGNADLLIARNFAWAGSISGIAGVGVARAAYEAALEFSKTYTAAGPHPIIGYQNVGYMLGDIATRIEAARLLCWRAAHYIDTHDDHGELVGNMSKVFASELMFDCVYKCMQVVGVNSYDKKHVFERYLREAACFPLYDAGNMGMRRRWIHGIIADPSFDPRALLEDGFVKFDKTMETIGTIQSDDHVDLALAGAVHN